MYNNIRQINMSSNRKLQYWWDGPFRVRAIKERNIYWLETLDGMPLRLPFLASRIKKFFKLDDIWLKVDSTDHLTPPKDALTEEARGLHE